MKNLKRRVLALTLVVAMAVGLAVPVLAIGSQSSGKMPIMRPQSLLTLGGFYAWAKAIGWLFSLPVQRSEPAGTVGPTDRSGPTIEPGKLHMSINASFPPYAMMDDAGNYVGIDIELAQAIANKLGLELVMEDMDFDVCLNAVSYGLSDIAMSGIAATDDRCAVMDFSDIYYRNIQVVVVKSDSPIVTPYDPGIQLAGVQRGTTGHIYACDTPEDGGYGEEHVIVYDTSDAAVQALRNDLVDCVILDQERAEAYVAVHPDLRLLDDFFADQSYAVAIGKGNTQLLHAVDQAIAQLREDGTLQAIIDKYIH